MEKKLRKKPRRRADWFKKKTKTGLHGIYQTKYNSYSYGAESRGLVFDLNASQFMRLWGANCIYCGGTIETIGIDRVDNLEGYTVDNSVPCCKRCNVIKMKLSSDDFVKACGDVYFTYNKKKREEWKFKLIIG